MRARGALDYMHELRVDAAERAGLWASPEHRRQAEGSLGLSAGEARAEERSFVLTASHQAA